MIVSISHRFASPESLGLVCASIYILLLILFIPFAFSNPISQQAYLKRSHEGLIIKEFPHYQVGTNTSNIIVWLTIGGLALRLPLLSLVTFDSDNTGLPGRRVRHPLAA
jgi:hypothetical protein